MVPYLATEASAGNPADVPVALRHLKQVVEGEAVNCHIPEGRGELAGGAEGDVVVSVVRHGWRGLIGSNERSSMVFYPLRETIPILQSGLATCNSGNPFLGIPIWSPAD
jgi:hypothetical protein